LGNGARSTRSSLRPSGERIGHLDQQGILNDLEGDDFLPDQGFAAFSSKDQAFLSRRTLSSRKPLTTERHLRHRENL
jgi:hypothetical protein